MATAQDTRIDQLADRVERLEAAVQTLRAEHRATAQQAPASATDQPDSAAHLWADMPMLRQEMRRLFDTLGIQHRPTDVRDLQRRLGAKLERNEFSRSIIEARDE